MYLYHLFPCRPNTGQIPVVNMKIKAMLQAGLTSTARFAGKESELLTSSFSSSLPPLGDTSQRIYLVRHGETDWNARGLIQGGGFDIELNDTGRQQAALVGEVLADLPITAVVSSHLMRASETADIVHTRFPGAKRLVLHEFGEMRFGSFEGLAIRGPKATAQTIEKLKILKEKMRRDVNQRCPGGGESTAEVETRAKQGLTKIFKEISEEHRHIVIVAHGRTNKVLLASLLLRDALQFGSIQQGNTCINVIDLDREGVWTSQTVNYVEHIQRYDPNAPPP
jgi:broad specificity phosphatase PhoE